MWAIVGNIRNLHGEVMTMRKGSPVSQQRKPRQMAPLAFKNSGWIFRHDFAGFHLQLYQDELLKPIHGWADTLDEWIVFHTAQSKIYIFANFKLRLDRPINRTICLTTSRRRTRSENRGGYDAMGPRRSAASGANSDLISYFEAQCSDPFQTFFVCMCTEYSR